MNLPRPTMPSFWRRRARPVEPSVVVDAADMGTCYGLEMSLRAPVSRGDIPALRTGDVDPWWERAEVRNACGA